MLNQRILLMAKQANFNGDLIRRIPLRHREDALQEAMLAIWGGRNPVTAVLNYYKSERAHETPAILRSR